MNRDTVFKLITDHGLTLHGDIEHFAALIEQHLEYDGIHTCHDQCPRPACVAVREAVQREREACAKVCDEHWRFNSAASECADAIRARGKK